MMAISLSFKVCVCVCVCVRIKMNNKFLSPLYNSEIQSEEDLDTNLTPTSLTPTSLTPTPRGGQRAEHVTTLATGVCVCVCVCGRIASSVIFKLKVCVYLCVCEVRHH